MIWIEGGVKEKFGKTKKHPGKKKKIQKTPRPTLYKKGYDDTKEQEQVSKLRKYQVEEKTKENPSY